MAVAVDILAGGHRRGEDMIGQEVGFGDQVNQELGAGFFLEVLRKREVQTERFPNS